MSVYYVPGIDTQLRRQWRPSPYLPGAYVLGNVLKECFLKRVVGLRGE